MTHLLRFAAVAAITVALSCGAVGGARADESADVARAIDALSDRFNLHGFAHQAFLISNSNANGEHFTGADTHGSFDMNSLALLFSFKATNDLSVWVQLFAGNESDMRLDWAYADYRINDSLRIRGGQIKAPLGLLNETRDIKYLHLSVIDPAIYSETAGIMFEAFRGASAILEHDVAGGRVTLDLFGGSPHYYEGEETEEKHYGLIGGRLQYETPVEGLLIGGTIATIKEREEEGGEEKSGSKTIAGGSLEYKHADLQLRSEYMQLLGIEHNKYGYYVEGGYTFADNWTPFVRYDYFTADKHHKSAPENYQEAVAFGVNYRFNKFASLRVEDQIIKGYALPAIEFEEENPGVPFAGDKHWNLFAVSLNLMF